MTQFYLDTSVAVHALLGTADAEAWFDRATANGADEIMSSRVLQTELTRVLRRERLPVSDRDVILDHVGSVRLTEAILASAEAIVPHVKALDAIHLASAIACGSQTIVVSHDANLLEVAALLGLQAHDPIGSAQS